MRAVVLTRHGPPQVLRPRIVPEPAPGAGEVRVRLEVVGVNYAEVLSRQGLYGWAPALPYTPGMEGAGVIDEIGPGVTEHGVGKRVVVGAQYGAYAEKIVVPATQALPVLPGFSMEENAAFPVNYLTAWVALMEMARLRPTDRVAITAAAGGVGTAAVQIAARFGCWTLALVGSDEKLTRVRELGASAAVNYRGRGFERRLREAAGLDGVDVVIDLVGGDVHRAARRSLAPFGRIVVAGFASLRLTRWNPLSWWRTWRDLPRADARTLAPDSHGLLATHLGYLLPDAERLLHVWSELTAFVAEHDIRPVIGARLPALAAVAEAHRLLESRRTIGKVVVRV